MANHDSGFEKLVPPFTFAETPKRHLPCTVKDANLSIVAMTPSADCAHLICVALNMYYLTRSQSTNDSDPGSAA